MTMSKICFPHHERGEFTSLANALKYIGAESYSTSRYALRDIVRCNVCYRNYLRRNGVEELIMRLMEEAPVLKDEPILLLLLLRWAEDITMAQYDLATLFCVRLCTHNAYHINICICCQYYLLCMVICLNIVILEIYTICRFARYEQKY